MSDTIDDGSDKGTIDLDSLGVKSHASGPTLTERVTSVLGQIPADQEFTVPHIEAILKNRGFEVPGKSPRARLAMIMTLLEKKGLVIRTARPKGFKPHKFKVIEQNGKQIDLVN